MTQHVVVDQSGVHRTYISDIEHGSRNITVTTANRIAAVLKTTGLSSGQASGKIERIKSADRRLGKELTDIGWFS